MTLSYPTLRGEYDAAVSLEQLAPVTNKMFGFVPKDGELPIFIVPLTDWELNRETGRGGGVREVLIWLPGAKTPQRVTVAGCDRTLRVGGEISYIQDDGDTPCIRTFMIREIRQPV